MLNESGDEIGEFYQNLQPLEWPAKPDHETMKWWKKHPEAWVKATENAKWPGVVMYHFRHWVEDFGERVIVVGYPITFDFTFVWWYLWYFTGGAPFTHGGEDIKTMAADALGCSYYDARKEHWPPAWFPPEGSHSHVAIEDAKEQAYSFRMIARELQELHSDANSWRQLQGQGNSRTQSLAGDEVSLS